MDQPLTKKQLIDTMRVERARWEMLLLRVGPGRMSVPVDVEGRTVAELIRSLYERECWLAGCLASAARASTSPVGALSPRAGLRAQDEPIEASRRAFNEILRLLIPLPEADLFARDLLPWTEGHTLAEVVSACTIAYYVQHDPPIRSWLSQPVGQTV